MTLKAVVTLLCLAGSLTIGSAGISSIGAGTAGGVTGSGTAPALDIFGGPTGIESGFILGVPVPEPSNVALSALGAVLLVGSRWRGKSGKKLRFF